MSRLIDTQLDGNGDIILSRNDVEIARVDGAGNVATKGTVNGGSIAAFGWASVKDVLYGAKGDGQELTDGAITSDAAILTSATGKFAPTDVGKVVVVYGAGAAGVSLVTTISGYTSATQVTLAANAGTTVTNASFVWGTDDTAAIQAAITAIYSGSSAESGGAGRGVVFFPPGSYVVTNLTMKSNITFQGSGWRVTALIATASSGYVFGVTGLSHGTRMNNVSFQGMTIGPTSRQAGLSASRPGSGGIDLSYSTWCSLRDVFIHNLGGIGINCLETFDVNSFNGSITWTGTNASTPALMFQEGTNDSTNSTHWYGLRIEQCPVPLRVAGTTFRAYMNQFVACKFEWHTNTTLTHAAAGMQLEAYRHIKFIGCQFVSDDSTFPLVETGNGTLSCYGTDFVGCDWLAPSGTQGWALNVNTHTTDSVNINGGSIELFNKGFTRQSTTTIPPILVTGLSEVSCNGEMIETGSKVPAVVGQALGTLLRTGLYYLTQPTSSNGTSVALGVGTLRLTPFYVPQQVTITRIGAEVTVIGDVGSKIRLGIYADDGTGYPGALVLDAGTIAGDSATTQEIVISQVLNPGLYWVGGAVQVVTTTQPTVRTFGSNPVVPTGFSAIPSAGATSQGYSMTGVTAGLGAFSGTVTASGLSIRTFVKVA